MRTALRHLAAFIAPLVMILLIPWAILRGETRGFTEPLLAASSLQAGAGGLLSLLGLSLFGVTVRLFILIGKGTIMPWDPAQNLTVAGIYQHVRNPMILSVITLLLGEAALFDSPGILIMAGLFFAINTVYFVLSEEPALEKRYGEAYRQYKRNVPRWLPRLKPWNPDR